MAVIIVSTRGNFNVLSFICLFSHIFFVLYLLIIYLNPYFKNS